MNELGLVIKDGKVKVSSLSVADKYGKRHDTVLRDIRNLIIDVPEALHNFVESSYINSQNKEMPCYEMDRQGFAMLVTGFTGQKAKKFTYQYTKGFEKLAKIAEEKSQQLNIVSFKEQVECVDIIAKSLNVNDASKIFMYNQLYDSYSLPKQFLPQYELNGNKQLKTATELLDNNNKPITTNKLNKILIRLGYLEEKTRASTKNKNKIKKYKALTPKGLEYGENAINSHNQKEVQPLYYEDNFNELLDIVMEVAYE